MTDLTPYLPQLAVAWTAYFIATASPGPAIIAIIATSISRGRRAGLALASGVLTGSYVWAILTASGLSALIRTYGEAIIVLKIVGGCYLLWLAWNAYRAARKSEETYRAQMAAMPPRAKTRPVPRLLMPAASETRVSLAPWTTRQSDPTGTERPLTSSSPPSQAATRP